MALEPFCQQTNNESETVVLVGNCTVLCLHSLCAVGYTALGYTTALRMLKAVRTSRDGLNRNH